MQNHPSIRPNRRLTLRALALLALAALPVPVVAQSARQAEGVLAQIDKTTWIAEGQGKRALYIFFDPNCPYCHKLYGMLRADVGKDDLQFRWIPLGMLTPSSLPKAAAILQAEDPLQAFHKNENDYDFAANGQPGGGIEPATTITPKVRQELARNLAVYNGNRLFGVPVMVWTKADRRAASLTGVPSDAELSSILRSVR
uniref:Thioredoxin-like fold domain-containing protein n=1 Tax=mine drainage metagenome TaxID=410659 RepID=E6PLF3_9ZZZZ